MYRFSPSPAFPRRVIFAAGIVDRHGFGVRFNSISSDHSPLGQLDWRVAAGQVSAPAQLATFEAILGNASTMNTGVSSSSTPPRIAALLTFPCSSSFSSMTCTRWLLTLPLATRSRLLWATSRRSRSVNCSTPQTCSDDPSVLFFLLDVYLLRVRGVAHCFVIAITAECLVDHTRVHDFRCRHLARMAKTAQAHRHVPGLASC
jgi:hypothetical protein